MKTIGLLGGMSWESTAHYYAHLNRLTQSALGGMHSARVLLHSFDFAELEVLQRAGDWPAIAARLIRAAYGLERAGAELLLICANTMHIVAPEIEAAINMPLLHIVDPTAEAIVRAGIAKVGLLGTSYTMEHHFFQDRLKRFGVECIVPEEADRLICHDIIFKELVRGSVKNESRTAFRTITRALAARGAMGIVLGCTELTMVIGARDAPVPSFDTAALHAEAAVRMALAGEEPSSSSARHA
jgi:aspartate racemase